MKIVQAFGSFKGRLAEKEVCRVMAETLRTRRLAWQIESVLLAINGERTVQALVDACKAPWWFVEGVTGPLPGVYADQAMLQAVPLLAGAAPGGGYCGVLKNGLRIDVTRGRSPDCGYFSLHKGRHRPF